MDDIIKQALNEDLGPGDVTVDALIPPDAMGTAAIVAKQDGVLAGGAAAARTFQLVDGELDVRVLVEDGAEILSGTRILEVRGAIGSLLKAERTALNFLQHLSGVATVTRSYVREVEGTGAVILDTRKTTPGLRLLEKAAVAAGGGSNHRIGLYDMVLIKDNHLAALGLPDEAAAVAQAVERARSAVPEEIRIEVEVRTLEGALAAVKAGADMILLDNMTAGELASAVEATISAVDATKSAMDATQSAVEARPISRSARPLLEASGGITLENVREVADTGVDRISVGALTHSVTALDIAMYVSFH